MRKFVKINYLQTAEYLIKVYPQGRFCYNLIITLSGPLAQLVEQTPLKRKVVSSSLTWPTLDFQTYKEVKNIGRVAESVDAYALGAYGAIREGSSPSPSRFSAMPINRSEYDVHLQNCPGRGSKN